MTDETTPVSEQAVPDSVELTDQEKQELSEGLFRLTARVVDEQQDNPADIADALQNQDLAAIVNPDEEPETDPEKMTIASKATALQAVNWIKQFLGQRDNAGAFIWERTEFKSYVGSAWCGATQLATCEALGLDIAPVKTHARLLYCPAVVDDAKAAGKFGISKNSKMGDWCLFDWNGDGVADHITMVLVNDPTKEYITVIGGNHGDGTTSGQRGVFIRTWPRSVVLGTVDRQGSYAKPQPLPAPASKPQTLKKGSKDSGTTGPVHNLQNGLLKVFPAIAAPIKNSGGADGIFGAGTETAVKSFQSSHGLVADGIVGPLTTAALARVGIKI